MNARLLQLASPALPIGGFSYSSGLEWAIESKQVHDAQTAFEWIDDGVTLTLAGFEAPAMLAGLRLLRRVPACTEHGEGALGTDSTLLDALVDLNERVLAARETPELRQESTQMGYSLGRWVESMFRSPASDEPLWSRLQPLALPLAWALAASRLALAERDAALGYVWSFAENQVMVLMKALPMGQVAAQRLLLALGPRVEAAVERSCQLGDEDWSSAAPGLALSSIRHETQYSRLFRS